MYYIIEASINSKYLRHIAHDQNSSFLSHPEPYVNYWITSSNHDLNKLKQMKDTSMVGIFNQLNKRTDYITYTLHSLVIALEWIAKISWYDSSQVVYVEETRMPAYKAITILPIFLCPIPTWPILYMMQHVVDWVAPFRRSQNSSPPPFKIFYTPSLSHLMCTRVRFNHNNNHIGKVLLELLFSME